MELFSDDEFLLKKMTAKGDPLEHLNQAICWEQFRPVLQKIFKDRPSDPSKGGPPPYDFVMMFKLLIIQRYNNLSDDAMEYMMLDRLSFRRLLEIDQDAIPDAKTIWLYKERLAQSGKGNQLFVTFAKKLESEGYIAHEGQIVDASFVEAPKQRNSRDENTQIKKGEVPEGWSDNKRRQKDTDARWTIKGNERNYGYKDQSASMRNRSLLPIIKSLPLKSMIARSMVFLLSP